MLLLCDTAGKIGLFMSGPDSRATSLEQPLIKSESKNNEDVTAFLTGDS